MGVGGGGGGGGSDIIVTITARPVLVSAYVFRAAETRRSSSRCSASSCSFSSLRSSSSRRFSDREEGDHPAFDGEIGPRQSERATEETANRLGVAGDERQIGQRIVAQNSDLLPLHEMHQYAANHFRVHETDKSPSGAGAADCVYGSMSGGLDLS